MAQAESQALKCIDQGESRSRFKIVSKKTNETGPRPNSER